jgi:hypothetical protein
MAALLMGRLRGRMWPARGGFACSFENPGEERSARQPSYHLWKSRNLKTWSAPDNVLLYVVHRYSSIVWLKHSI